MDAEILVAAELSEHGVRNRADTHLQAGPVFDQRGAVFADRRLDFVGLREMSFLERRVVLHEQVDVVDVNERVAERAGNMFVDHGDHRLRAFDGGQRRVDRRAERYIAVRVGRRNLNHRDVARKHAAAVELLRLAQEDGNVVGVARLRHLTHVPADEKRVELENPFELGSGIGSRALGVQMVYVNVLQLAVAAPLAHGLDQALRSAGHAAQMDVVMAFDCPDGLLGRDEMDRFGHCV